MKRPPPIVALLCAAAGLRVLLLAASFPLFNNVDEAAHFDLVYKYAHGEKIAGLAPFSPGAARLIARYGSPEYYYSPERYGGRPLPAPLWSRPGAETAEAQAAAAWEGRLNQELTQPPVYYAAAACWYRLGGLLGLSEARAVYWIRFLDALILALLVWAAHLFAEAAYPGRTFLNLGVPALVAFLPQSALYSITNDALSPLISVAAFLFLLEIARGRPKSPVFHAAAGFLAAAAFLIKITNFPVLVVCAAVLFLGRRSSGRALALLGLSAAFPVVLWMARNLLVLGDLAGTSELVRLAGWSLKPLGLMGAHPLFSPEGMAYFAGSLTKTFWRGEFIWRGEPLAAAGVDWFFAATTALFLAAAAAPAPWFKAGAEDPLARRLSFLALGLSILFMAAVSVGYDFGDRWVPSREVPYYVSGRLISWGIVPFAALYLDGLDQLLRRTGASWPRWAALLVVLLVAAGSEAALALDALRSPYNWFHLP